MDECGTPELPFEPPEPMPPREPGERWLSVADFPSYMVSDFGRIWSRPRTKSRGGILKHNVDKVGRHGVNLTRPDGRQKFRRVHQLVAEAFLGPCPEGKEACHKNDDHDNNRADNLIYDTHARNMEMASENGVTGNGRKTHCRYDHEYTPENTRIGKSGSRFCISCSQLRFHGKPGGAADPAP